MNKKMLQAIETNDIQKVLDVTAEVLNAHPELEQFLTDLDIQPIVTATVFALMEGVGTVNRQSPDWSTLTSTAMIQVGLEQIKKSPASTILIHAILLFAFALMDD